MCMLMTIPTQQFNRHLHVDAAHAQHRTAAISLARGKMRTASALFFAALGAVLSTFQQGAAAGGFFGPAYANAVGRPRSGFLWRWGLPREETTVEKVSLGGISLFVGTPRERC